eukprot:TRINITY_DN48686_c0_g1_i1.p1 TRINITY_DN48686_c0_g1~~TRINITY_DN48686_c0_g1_i1.p1  ORF type:complete len:254 (-),score=28.51 TRINITY_DN48686_c0_g1_i1:457-1125(-)
MENFFKAVFGLVTAILASRFLLNKSERTPLVVVHTTDISWNFHESDHPDESVRERQQLHWKELTRSTRYNSTTGLTAGLLKLQPGKELPLHFHPEPFGETYYFTRGNGVVRLGVHADQYLGKVQHDRLPGGAEAPRTMRDYEERGGFGFNALKPLALTEEELALSLHDVTEGLLVNIPAGTPHGIIAGDEGCEFVWHFSAGRWTDIPYLYVDPKLSDRNVVT